jgi:pSer/pThr/pTyr-binding forkhead associated (FHA) protein
VARVSQSSPVVEIREPGRTPIRLVVSRRPIEVGRACHGVLLTDPQVSRRHLSLEARAGTVRVTDLDSHNGTRVDGVPIDGRHTLVAGEVVQLGATTIVLVDDERARPTTARRSTNKEQS